MTPFYSDESTTLFHGDVLDVLRQLESNSFDGCLTDPPYGLSSSDKRSPQRKSGVEQNRRGFMGLEWDGQVPGSAVWRELLRVMVPGSFLLAFGGTRTHHRLMCAIEDGGFEIRDCLMWLYGSGFPKSLNVGMAIDKAARGVPQGGADPNSVNHGKYKGGCSEENPEGRGFGAGPGQFMVEAGQKTQGTLVEEAQPWSGYGTSLKPAWEPIILAMKPCDGTFAENALKWGVAGLDIDGSRVESGSRPWREARRNDESDEARNAYGKGLAGSRAIEDTEVGRWPANVIHDGSDEVLECFPDAPGQLADVSMNSDSRKNQNCYGAMKRGNEASANRRYTENGSTNFAALPGARRNDSGSAARFFYCAKASSSERNGNPHPTVKPIKLTEYLAKLILPPKRDEPRCLIVPFAGSGSEMIGALSAGWDSVTGIERGEQYLKVASERISARRLSQSVLAF